jgi:hypothetical protein
MSKFFASTAALRAAEYNRYFRIMSEGVVGKTVEEYRDEMEQLAMHCADPALRKKCEQEISRYDGLPFAIAANSR